MTFNNLWVGYNEKEKFRILICAFDEEDANELAQEYRFDSGLEGKFKVAKAEKVDDLQFDCDYVIA